MSLRSSLRTEGISVRSIFTFVLVVAITAFLWALLGNSTLVNAAEASWDGESIRYEGQQYFKIGEASSGDSHNLPEGSIYYAFIEQQRPEDPPSSRVTSYKAHVIYFAPGADPPTASTATYIAYDYDNEAKTFSNPSQPQSVEMDVSTATNTGTSCAIEGIGYIVCSVSVFLAQGMDWVFNVLTGFMEVQPINVSNTDSDLYKAWDVMRNIANVAFIIAFTIIIYSQLTSIGLSNYSLKKMLPRLIIAAILVNLSFVISAIAVDVSNIFGYSLQDIFLQIRNELFDQAGKSWGDSMSNWESITGFIISGGTAMGAGAIGLSSAVIATGGSITSAVFLLLPALMGLLLAILVVLLILAARQAIIIIFVIIAPLAFVAYLLPNTEKWFNKWKDVFMTMLIFFPAFSVVFGGSQLAGAVIIQNANSINVVILGMIVQVAPLVITPMLLKFSGSLLGRIAGIMNNPNKGLVDRTRKWATGHAEYNRYRAMSGINRKGEPQQLRKRNIARRYARASENRRRNLEKMTENAKAHSDNNYHASKKYAQLHDSATDIALDKSRIDARLEEHTNKQTNTRGGRFYVKNLEAESAKIDLETEKVRTQTISDSYKSGLMEIETPGEGASRSERSEAQKLSDLAQRMSRSSIELSAETRAGVAAKQAQQKSYADALESSDALKTVAGGIDPNGAQRAYAEAISIINRNQKENIENIKAIITYKGLNDAERYELVKGISQDGLEASAEARAAAIESLLESASPQTIANFIQDVDFEDADPKDKEMLLGAYGAAMQTSKFRPAFFDFGRIAKLKQGLNPDDTPIVGSMGESGVHDMIMGVIEKRTLSVGAMQEMFSPYARMIQSTVKTRVQDINSLSSKEVASLGVLRDRLHKVLDPNSEGYAKLGDSEDVFRDTLRHIESVIGPGQTPGQSQ